MTVFDAIVRLTRASWKVLRRYPILIAFPVLQFLAVIALWIVVAPIFFARPGWPILFAIALAAHLVRLFFTVGLTGEALKALRGEAPSLGCGMMTAVARLPAIVVLSLITSTVGFVLGLLGRTTRGALWFARLAIGGAWSLATYLAIPVMVQERRGGIRSLRRSGDLFARTWGETTLSEVGLRVFSANLGLLLLVVMLIALEFFGNSALAILLVLGLIVSVFGAIGALEAIYRAALYVFAAEGVIPEPFGGSDLDDIWRVK